MIRRVLSLRKPLLNTISRQFSMKPNENRPSLGENMPKSNNLDNNYRQDDSDNEDEGEFDASTKKLKYILLISAATVGFVYFSVKTHRKYYEVPVEKRVGDTTFVGRAKIGGPFKAIKTDGSTFTQADLAGKYYLIYFGFTQCPDVCPVSLNKIAHVLRTARASKDYRYFDLECVFVSVDPDRDTAQKIDAYTKIFDDSIIGVTGKSNDDPDLKAMLKTYKIHASKIKLTEEESEKEDQIRKEHLKVDLDNKYGENYSMDHTIVTYLFGPENNFITYLSSNLSQNEMYKMVHDCIVNDLDRRASKKE